MGEYMSMKCKLFGHKWNGCTCETCKEKRDEGHKYYKIERSCIQKCRICGKEITIHDFSSHKCRDCGAFDEYVTNQNEWYTYIETYTTGDYKWLCGYRGKSLSKCVIPESINGISTNHFDNLERNDDILEVIFPSTLKSTGLHTFTYCKNIKKVYLNEGLETIDQSTFSGCSSLEEINIPSTLKSIQYAAFAGCENLKDIYLPGSLIGINNNPFLGCKHLTITCHKDSAAHKFVLKNNIQFKLL
jgi:hypothetical protein